MKTDAFKSAGGYGEAVVRSGPKLQGVDLGQHFKMQAQPKQTQPMAPRSFKEGAGRFQPAVEPMRLGSTLPAAAPTPEGRSVAPERQQGSSKFAPANGPLPTAASPRMGAPAPAAQAQRPQAAAAGSQETVSSVLVTVEAEGPDKAVYSAQHIVDFPAGSRILGIKHQAYSEQSS